MTSSDEPSSTNVKRPVVIPILLFAVVCLLMSAFLQWRYIDTLKTELDLEKKKSSNLMREVAALGN